MPAEIKINYSLRQLILYFLHLGYSGFGGPVALAGYMHRDLVENRKWISEEEYKEGLALAQLAPGPLAAQLSMYLGFVHYRIIGATLVSLAFVMPSFLMVVVIGVAYKMFGGLPWMQAIFYGVGAAVTGIVVVSTYNLTTRSVGKINFISISKNLLLWVLFLCSATVTIITQKEQVLLFIGAGIIYMLIKVVPRKVKIIPAVLIMLSGSGFWQTDSSVLLKIALFFGKAGAFVFGSGLAIIPFLHGSVVNEFHWLDEKQFLDAVAVAMITPGPVIITVGFIGYLVAGLPGACVAALATFLPCYLITIVSAPYFYKFAKNASVKAFVDGITAAVIGALAGAVVIIAIRSITDITTLLIALTSAMALLFFKKNREPYIILTAALIGFILKTSLFHII